MKLSKTLLTSVLTFALFGNSTFSKTLKDGVHLFLTEKY